MKEDKELAYKLIAQYGREWLKEDSQALYQIEKEIKNFPKEMRKSYEDTIKKDKDFLLQIGAILMMQENKEKIQSSISVLPQNLTIIKACELMGISRTMFYKLMKDGMAPNVIKLGRRSLVSSDSLKEWLKKMERVQP